MEESSDMVKSGLFEEAAAAATEAAQLLLSQVTCVAKLYTHERK